MWHPCFWYTEQLHNFCSEQSFRTDLEVWAWDSRSLCFLIILDILFPLWFFSNVIALVPFYIRGSPAPTCLFLNLLAPKGTFFIHLRHDIWGWHLSGGDSLAQGRLSVLHFKQMHFKYLSNLVMNCIYSWLLTMCWLEAPHALENLLITVTPLLIAYCWPEALPVT